jgi:hypothetical protein
MGQFAVRILILTAIGTMFAVIVGYRLQARPASQISSDAGDLNWHCYDELLKVTTLQVVRGESHLCVGERSVKVIVDAEDLIPGEIYTAWMAYIDAPGSCAATPCPLLEFPRLDHPPLLSKLDAAVVDETRHATFSCTLRGLAFAQGSQVQLLLAAHGMAVIGDRRAHQILGARWPERYRDASGGEGVIARSHFTMHWFKD